MASVLGLDIGGANLKAAHTNGTARSVPFALWKNPAGLTAMLRDLIAALPAHDRLAVTKTGELCDCYASRREGVLAILDSVTDAARSTPVQIWTNRGSFLSIDEARQDTLAVASANWLALATWAGRLVPDTPAILLDMGTTTTDIVPISNGKPTPQGRTDAKRLETRELVYVGWRRTPVAAVIGLDYPVASELFATTLDAYVMLGMISENETDCDTADGRPATREFAHARLCRMMGRDGEDTAHRETEALAERVSFTVETLIVEGIRRQGAAFRRERISPFPQAYVLGGSGESILRKILGGLPPLPIHSVSKHIGPAISEAACAYAVAVLASESMQAE